MQQCVPMNTDSCYKYNEYNVVWKDSNKNWIFYEFLKLLQNLAKDPVVHGLWQNFIKNGKVRILHFYYIF